MNQPKRKTAVKITMRLTWKNRWAFLRSAFKIGPTVTYVDNDAKEVLIKEEERAVPEVRPLDN